MDMLPKVKVSFVISGKDFDLSMLTEELNISPSETRSLEDWPEAVKNNVHIPEELQPVYEWCISEKEELCLQIETPIRRIISQIEGKEQVLMEFCKRYGLKKSLCMVIHGEDMGLPDITLSPYIVGYFGKLETLITFDIYVY